MPRVDRTSSALMPRRRRRSTPSRHRERKDEALPRRAIILSSARLFKGAHPHRAGPRPLPTSTALSQVHHTRNRPSPPTKPATQAPTMGAHPSNTSGEYIYIFAPNPIYIQHTLTLFVSLILSHHINAKLAAAQRRYVLLCQRIDNVPVVEHNCKLTPEISILLAIGEQQAIRGDFLPKFFDRRR